MKTRRLIFPILILTIIAACGEKQDCSPVQTELDQTKRELAQRDSILDAIGLTFQAIDSNMKQMRIVESEIMIQMKEKVRDKDAIRENVEKMRSIMELNQSYITRLEENLGATSANSAHLFSIISSMEEKMEMNNLRMAHLNHDLGMLGDDFKDIFQEYMQAEVDKMTLQANLEMMEGSMSSMEEKMNELQKNLNTVYFAIGNKRELIKSGVLEKGGLLRSEDVNQDMVKKNFEAHDLREFTSVNLGSRHKIITDHPTESYRINTKDELIIKDPKLFWSISKFLIVVSE